METSIPSNVYTGKSTPFGGPSLEWVFTSTGEDAEGVEEAKTSARGVPEVIIANIVHLRRALSIDYPRNSANVQRKLLCIGVPVIERISEKYPKRVEEMKESFFHSSEDGLRDYLMRNESVYRIGLGPVKSKPYTIFAKNKNYISKIYNMAEDMGLTGSAIAILCLVAGLAQSLETSWVPLGWREKFIKEIKYLDAWLAANWR